jgi:hypothetical protein
LIQKASADTPTVKLLEEENSKLKRLLADPSLDTAIRQSVLRRSLIPAQRFRPLMARIPRSSSGIKTGRGTGRLELS